MNTDYIALLKPKNAMALQTLFQFLNTSVATELFCELDSSGLLLKQLSADGTSYIKMRIEPDFFGQFEVLEELKVTLLVSSVSRILNTVKSAHDDMSLKFQQGKMIFNAKYADNNSAEFELATRSEDSSHSLATLDIPDHDYPNEFEVSTAVLGKIVADLKSLEMNIVSISLQEVEGVANPVMVIKSECLWASATVRQTPISINRFDLRSNLARINASLVRGISKLSGLADSLVIRYDDDQPLLILHNADAFQITMHIGQLIA